MIRHVQENARSTVTHMHAPADRMAGAHCPFLPVPNLFRNPSSQGTCMCNHVHGCQSRGSQCLRTRPADSPLDAELSHLLWRRCIIPAPQIELLVVNNAWVPACAQLASTCCSAASYRGDDVEEGIIIGYEQAVRLKFYM